MIEQVRPHRFSLEHYHAMIDAGVFVGDERVELIHGAVVDMSPIGNPHMACVRRLNRVFTAIPEERVTVSVQDALMIPPDSEPEPDIVLYKPRADFYAKERATPGDVLLVVEVADSSLIYDRLVKIPLYASAAIPEYWIVDIASDAIEVYRQPAGDHYAQLVTYKRGDRITTEAFPDHPFEVDRVLP